MKISIITATYNSEKTIGKTIRSIEAQSYKNVELIVIDNVSTDNTIDIIKSINIPNCKIISEKDKGIYDALNKGIRNSTGDIIGFLHSDDEFYNELVLDSVYKGFSESQVDTIYGNGILISGTSGKLVRNWISGDFSIEKLKNGWMPMHPTFYVKRHVYETYGLFSEDFKISADYDLILRLLLGKRISTYYINSRLVIMKLGGASTSLKNIYKKWKEDWIIMKKHGLNPWSALFIKNTSKIKQFLNKKIN
jgi:glycosyltransferase